MAKTTTKVVSCIMCQAPIPVKQHSESQMLPVHGAGCVIGKELQNKEERQSLSLLWNVSKFSPRNFSKDRHVLYIILVREKIFPLTLRQTLHLVFRVVCHGNPFAQKTWATQKHALFRESFPNTKFPRFLLSSSIVYTHWLCYLTFY